jgi:hypothetical protein
MARWSRVGVARSVHTWVTQVTRFRTRLSTAAAARVEHKKMLAPRQQKQKEVEFSQQPGACNTLYNKTVVGHFHYDLSLPQLSHHMKPHHACSERACCNRLCCLFFAHMRSLYGWSFLGGGTANSVCRLGPRSDQAGEAHGGYMADSASGNGP